MGWAVLGVMLSAAPAHTAMADTSACIAASEKAQSLRDAGTYRAARKSLITCSAAECPHAIQRDCLGWLDEVDALTPSVVLGAAADGRELTDVRVYEDGTLFASSLDGRPLPVDPGPHRYRFEYAGAAATEQTIVIRAGEKNRIVTAAFTMPRASPRTPPARRALLYSLGSGAAASFIAGVVLDVSGYVFIKQCNADPTCSATHERSEVTWRFVTGDSLTLVGLAAGATTYWLARRTPEPKPFTVGLSILPSGGALTSSLTLRF